MLLSSEFRQWAAVVSGSRECAGQSDVGKKSSSGGIQQTAL